MLERLYPDQMCGRVADVDLESLKSCGVRGLILDIDNTLSKSGARRPEGAARDFVERAALLGFRMCIVSNAGIRRAEAYAGDLGLACVGRARKPRGSAFLQAAGIMELAVREAAVIGDQVFTDVLGARNAGMYAVLTRPIFFLESFFVMLKRIPEFFVLCAYRRHAAAARAEAVHGEESLF